MVSIYFESVPGFIEGEDILVKYAIYNEEDELIHSKQFSIDYVIPLISDHAALLAILKHLKKYNDEDEIVFFINNASLFAQLNGHSTIKKEKAIVYCDKIMASVSKLRPLISIEDVSPNHNAMLEWKKALDVF